MKTIRSISLDTEVAEELNKEENASDLINKLLKNHFFDKQFQEKSLEEKLKEVDELQTDILKSKQEEKERLDQEIRLMEERKRELMNKQKEELEQSLNLVETNKELADQFLDVVKVNSDIPKDARLLIDWVDKFRKSGIKLGVTHLQQYAKVKLKDANLIIEEEKVEID